LVRASGGQVKNHAERLLRAFERGRGRKEKNKRKRMRALELRQKGGRGDMASGLLIDQKGVVRGISTFAGEGPRERSRFSDRKLGGSRPGAGGSHLASQWGIDISESERDPQKSRRGKVKTGILGSPLASKSTRGRARQNWRVTTTVSAPEFRGKEDEEMGNCGNVEGHSHRKRKLAKEKKNRRKMFFGFREKRKASTKKRALKNVPKRRRAFRILAGGRERLARVCCYKGCEKFDKGVANLLFPSNRGGRGI